MKKILLILFVFAAFQMGAQTNYDITWDFGTNPGNADQSRNGDRTIELGDSVTWTFAGSSTHTVDSNAGAVQPFSSGPTRLGPGTVYSVTFNVLGTNPYRCNPHPGSMNGTITVVETLSAEDKFRLNLQAFPNPVQDDLTITSLIKVSNVEVYSMLGKKVISKNVGNVTITNVNMGNLQAGLYFVNVTAENGQTSVLRVMKK